MPFLDDRRVEELSSGRSRGAGIRVVDGETTGFAHTADLSKTGLLAAARAAAAVTRQGGNGVRTVALDPLTAHGRGDRTAPDSVEKARKLELLTRADDAARAAGGAITQVQVGCGDSRRRILIANSDGLLAQDEQIRTRFNVTCVANGDTGMQTGYESLARTEGYEIFERHRVEDIAGVAAARALANSRPARRRPVRCPSCWPAGAAASSFTKPAATGSKPTTSSRTRRSTPARSESWWPVRW